MSISKNVNSNSAVNTVDINSPWPFIALRGFSKGCLVAACKGKGDLFKFISETGFGSEAYLFLLFIILLIGLFLRFSKCKWVSWPKPEWGIAVGCGVVDTLQFVNIYWLTIKSVSKPILSKHSDWHWNFSSTIFLHYKWWKLSIGNVFSKLLLYQGINNRVSVAAITFDYWSKEISLQS